MFLSTLPVIFTSCFLVVSGTEDYVGQGELPASDGLSMDIIEGQGHWTKWMNGDMSKTTFSAGDFETMQDYIPDNGRVGINQKTQTCEVWSTNGLAVRWRFAPTNNFTPEQAELAAKCIVVRTPDELAAEQSAKNKYIGFDCYNMHQRESICTRDECVAAGMYTGKKRDFNIDGPCDRCPDFEVQYLLKDAPPADTGAPCPAASGTNTQEAARELEERAQEIEEKQQEMDARVRELSERYQGQTKKEQSRDGMDDRVERLLQKLLERYDN